MNRYTAVVIGAGGSIGGLKPDKLDNLDTFNVLTWAHALSSRSPNVSLVAISDIDKEKLDKACNKWCVKGYLDYKEMLDKEKPDIVVVATPTETHYEVLTNVAVLSTNFKAVIAEKPFCENFKQAEDIVVLYKGLNIPISVDYIRRYDKIIGGIKDSIRSGDYGIIQNCRIVYVRGLIRDGSHGLDLCRFFFGEYKCGKIDYDCFINDYSDKDLTYKVDLEFDLCKNVNFTPVDGRAYDIFEIDILGTKGRIKLVEHSNQCNIYNVIPEKIYGNYNTISHAPIHCRTGLTTALLNVVENVIEHIEDGKELICTGEDALAVHRIYDNLFANY